MTTESTAQNQQSEVEHEELLAWLETVQSVAGVGGTLARLFHAEVRLALSSVRRLLVVGLVIVPLMLFAWLGFSILMSWLLYWASVQSIASDSAIAAALFGFFFLQVGAIYLMSRLWSGYRKHLHLPATRRQLRLIREELDNALQATQG